MRANIAIAVMVWSLVLVHGGRAVYGQSLESKLGPLIQSHAGNVAIAIKHIESEERFSHRGDEPQATASLIKLPVMVAAYQQAEDDKIALDRPVTLRGADKVPGSGILTTHFSDGTIITLRDAIRLMIAFSDNTATNLVVDVISLPTVNDHMKRLGLNETRIHAKVYRRETSIDPDRSQRLV